MTKPPYYVSAHLISWPKARLGDGNFARRAFTLIELLAVMGIMIIMLALLVPSITGIKGASDLTKAAYGVSDFLEQARSYAMANQTYVFVGLAETDVSKPASVSPQIDGVGRFAMAAV